MVIDSPEGTGPNPHSHPEADEWCYLLSGYARFTVEGQDFDVRDGDMVHSHRGATHHFIVASVTAWYLAGYASGDDEQAFKGCRCEAWLAVPTGLRGPTR